MSPEISVAFQTDKPLSAYGPLAAAVEEAGFHGVTVYNDMLYQPAWYPLMEIARATQRVRIGPAAVNPFTCHPMQIAAQTALLDEASRSRTYLGLARGGWLDYVGMEPKQPILALREAFAAIRHLLRQSREPLEGDLFPLAGGDTLRWKVPRATVPFLLGSWGPKTIAACIEQIQEIKIGGSANPDVIPLFRDYIQRAQSEKLNPQPVSIAIGAVTVVDEDGVAARALARREVALYLPVVAMLDPSTHIEPALLRKLRHAAARYDYDAAAALISDELLSRFALAGTPEQVADQTVQLLKRGADRVEFGTPHGLTAERGIQLLGDRVLPLIRESISKV